MKKKNIIIGLTVCLLGTLGIVGSSMARAAAPDEENPQETVEAIEDEDGLETDLEDDLTDEDMETEEGEWSGEESPDDSQDNQEDASMMEEENTQQRSEEIVGMKVTLLNRLSCDIVSIQVSPSLEDTYSDNLMLDEVLKAGEESTFGIPEAYQNMDGTLYDLKMTDANGMIIEVPMVPLLEDTTGELYEQYGLTMVRVVDKRLEAEEELPSDSELLKEQEKIKKALADSLTSDVAF